MHLFQKRIPVFTLHLLLLILPLLFSANTEELFEFPKMLVIYSAALILAGSWLISCIQAKKIRVRRSIFDIPILVFVGSQILSTLFSIDQHTSVFGYYSRFNGGLLSVLAYTTIFYTATQFITKENVQNYLRSLILGAVLTALYAIPEHFGASPSCLLITGKFVDDCWIQDVQTRIFGTLGQPNWLAAYMVVVLPLIVAKISNFKFQISKNKVMSSLKLGLWILTFILFSLVLLYTKSRSGILGAGVALSLLAGLSLFVQDKTNKISSILKPITYYLSPVLIFCILTLTIANPVKDKVFSLLHIPDRQSQVASRQSPATSTQLDTGGSESGDIRKVVWTGAIKVWLRYPILGSGVETFAYSYYKDRPKEHNLLSEWDYLYNKAHNEFLNYLATTGTVGFLAYVLLYGSFIIVPIYWGMKFKEFSPPAGGSILQFSISAALAGLAVSNFFGFSTVVVSFLTFFLPALAVISADQQEEVTVLLPKFMGQPLFQKILICSCILIIFNFQFSIFNLYFVDSEYSQAKSLIDQRDVEQGVPLLQSAVNLAPNEPVYRDELSYTAARLAYAFAVTGDSTKSAQLAQSAIDNSDVVLEENPVNVNFYKTRARIFTLLGEISPVFYGQAVNTLRKAEDLSPTDPKITYDLAVISSAQGNQIDQEKYLLATLTLRPIDVQAHTDLAMLYESQKKPELAIPEFQAVLKLDPSNTEAKTHIASLSGKIKK